MCIYEEAFAKTDKTDAILLVRGKKMHVNKSLLSYHSDFFNTLFNSDFKEKSMEEIPIDDVIFENFATLLSLVHDSPLPVTHFNAENLIKLSDRFLLKNPKIQVERFIIASTEFQRSDKLKLADKYELETLLDDVKKQYYSDQQAYQDFYPKMNISNDLRLEIRKTPIMCIYEETFAKTDKTDAILVVGEKKMHVNKSLLSYHSDYFNTLFNSDFKEKSMEEIPIDDVIFEDFATLLSLVHGNPLSITKSNAENLIKLADRFLLSASKSHVELFIIASSEFNRFEKLKLADKYKLEKLLESTLPLYYDDRLAFKDFYSVQTISDDLRLKMFDYFFQEFSWCIQ